jgi:hydrogenase nickel incorporation protein HypA/HybF
MPRMHELAICEAVLQQVLGLPACRDAAAVTRIVLRIGPLAGVEPDLLRHAFPLVAAGTPCADAAIEIESTPVEVRCHICRSTTCVPPNRLLCARCGTWHVAVISGDEMRLASIELMDVPHHSRMETTNV